MKTKLIALVVFAWLAIGAKDCTGWGWSNNGTDGYTSAGAGGGSSCASPMGSQGGASAGQGAGGMSFGSGAGGDPGESPQGLTCGTGSTVSVDQQTADNALAGANAAAVANAELQAEYTAYVIAGMISAQVTDSSKADAATLQALAEQFAPSAAAQAKQWVNGLSPSAIPLFTVDPEKQLMCVEQFGCNFMEKCPNIGVCALAGCGSGKCSTCPNIFNVNSLLIKGWCAHVCIGSDGTGATVGFSIVIHFRGGVEWRRCYATGNQN